MSLVKITITRQIDEVREVELPVYTLRDTSEAGTLSLGISQHEAQRTVTLHETRYSEDHYNYELQVYPHHGLQVDEDAVTVIKEKDFEVKADKFLWQLEQHTGVLTRYLQGLGGVGVRYDQTRETLVIAGVAYATVLFHELGLGGMQVGQVFRLVRREDQVVTIERLDPAP